ncbi:MAG: sugar ABC transporter permease [Clostridia bacterium]|nr:sugar ABC transporter permease [Clostridia bacterium]
MNSHSKKAGALSVLYMGLGQIYNKQYIKGIILAAIETAFIIFMIPYIGRSIWGLITLGETPQRIVKGKVVQGDHSIFLMVLGIIGLMVAVVFLVLYLINVSDAYKVGKLRDKGKLANNFKTSISTLLDKGFPYLLLSPAFIFVLFLTVLPLIFGVMIAFTDYSGPNHLPPRVLVEWVGFDTFKSLFTMTAYKTTFIGVGLWTVIWAILATITSFFFGLVFAVLINSKGIQIKKFWRTLYILPWAMPSFISILIMRTIFNGQFGPVNKFLVSMGMEGLPWLSDANLAKTVCIMVNIWLSFPYYMAMMSGILTGISKDLYEAAEVEGASESQKFWKITIPLVMFAAAPLLILGFTGNFNNFTLIYLINEGGPANPDYQFAGGTDILLSWIYKLTLDNNKYNLASVVSILIFILIAVISIINFRRTKSFKEEDMIQ